MAHPKRKISKSRRNKRRANYKAQRPNISTCNNCNAAVLWHRLCDNCGHYRGQKVIEKEEF